MSAELTVLNNEEHLQGKRSFSYSSCKPDERSGGQSKGPLTILVRYGLMNYIGEFKYTPDQIENCRGRIVVQTQRGIELGEQVSLTCSGCSHSIPKRTMQEYAKNSGPEFLQNRAGRVLRPATPQDMAESSHLDTDAKNKLGQARDIAAKMGLKMKFIACEHLLGGERIIFHFTSEGRVDFRDLVRQLAHEYHTRIEMHQVGARDEARLVADYEICGRECCCKNFLKKLRQVNMKMAKLQKATLDPSKVSGRCGRLRCCLRFEHEGYEELNKKLPKVGSRIRTEHGVATVKDRHILTQLLNVIFDDSNELFSIGVEDVLETGLPKKPPEQGKASDDPKNRRGARPPKTTRSSRQPDAKRQPAEDKTSTDEKEDASASSGEPKSRKSRRSRRRSSRKREHPAEAAGAPADGSQSSEARDTTDRPAPQGDRSGVADEQDEAADKPKRRRRRRGRRRRKPKNEAGDASQGGGPAESGKPQSESRKPDSSSGPESSD